jgi:CRISPR-associated protein Csh1
VIEKLAKLGKIVPEDMFLANPLGLKKKYSAEDILFIEFSFDEENEKWSFEKITIEEYSQSKNDKYLLKTLKGRATSEFPTIDVYKTDDLLKNGDVSFTESKKGKELVYILNKYDGQFDEIVELLKNNPVIARELKEKVNDLKRFALSVKINGEYPGDSQWIAPKIELLKNREGNKNHYTYDGKKYEASNKFCSVTGKKEDRIWGYVTPHKDYKFYAVKTEKRVVAGGFNPKTAWKNFPVSPAGAEILEKGAKFFEKHLKFKFCGYKYFLIPEKVLSNGDSEEYLEDLQDFKTFKSSGEEEVNRTLEDDLLELLKDNNNYVNYTLFFYKIINAEFKILSVAENVFPSYFREIFETKNSAESNDIFQGLKSKDGPYDIKFNFSDLKTFFPEPKPFLEIVRSIFMQKQIDYTYLLSVFIKNIQVDFSNDRNTQTKTLKAFLILSLLQNLQLIKQSQTGQNVIMDNKYETFFEEHADFFDSATKKGIFLEGVLTKKLLNNQYEMRESTPFRSQLKSLKLNERTIKKLLPKIIDKLESYDRNYYEALETEISKYLIKADFKKISNDEISFYFTMGLNLAKEFEEKKETNDKVN